jgi:hypothetical protein
VWMACEGLGPSQETWYKSSWLYVHNLTRCRTTTTTCQNVKDVCVCMCLFALA